MHNLQGLHRGVLLKVVRVTDSARHRHQGHAVVLDQSRGSNDCTVQLKKPARGRRRNDGMESVDFEAAAQSECVCVCEF